MKFELLQTNSSYIGAISWEDGLLCIQFCNGYEIEYADVPIDLFKSFLYSDSFGKFYNTYIKSKFKKNTIMAEQPKGINKAKDEKRYINLRLDMKKVNKDWLFKGKDGAVYLDCTLHMLPNGEVDKYECLGFMTQDVPKDLAKKDKELRGEILGNGKELEWEKKVSESTPGSGAGERVSTGDFDDLPF